jgi:hypothetical protein
MIPTRIRFFVLAIGTLLLARPPVRGDYFWTDTEHGTVSVTTYPTDGTSLQPGQARIHFDGRWYGKSAPEFLDFLAFNTDLTLSPNQITVPKGWKLTSNGVVPGFGRFSWLLQTSNQQPNDGLYDVTISGLGDNVSASHFWQSSTVTGITPPVPPATFAFHDGVIDYYHGRDPSLRVPQGPDTGWFSVDTRPPLFATVTSSPEPSAVVLLGVGLAALLGWNALRRRLAQAAGLVRT